MSCCSSVSCEAVDVSKGQDESLINVINDDGEEKEDEGLIERPDVIFFHRLGPSNSWATSSKPVQRENQVKKQQEEN